MIRHVFPRFSLENSIRAGDNRLGLYRFNGPLGRYFGVYDSGNIIFERQFVNNHKPLINSGYFNCIAKTFSVNLQGPIDGSPKRTDRQTCNGEPFLVFFYHRRERDIQSAAIFVNGCYTCTTQFNGSNSLQNRDTNILRINGYGFP